MSDPISATMARGLRMDFPATSDLHMRPEAIPQDALRIR